ncbi:hypothetical protein J6590_098456 [Homalodisca vitripennis]|nr:hypothetical protein J6590_098456 [Homalodisca vitripennis]
MLAVISFAVLVAVASSAPQELRQQQQVHAYLLPAVAPVPTTQSAQIAYLVGAPSQYQVSSFQPSQQISTIKYSQPQPQQVQVQYRAPEIYNRVYSQAALSPAPVPTANKALVRGYQVQEGQVPQWAIVRSSLDNNFDGRFQYAFETENGIALNAVGDVKQLSPQEQAQVIQGSYSYTAPDGQVITTSYTADENGFVAQGNHLPVAPEEPELPPLIAKSLAYIRSLPPQPENQQ